MTSPLTEARVQEALRLAERFPETWDLTDEEWERWKVRTIEAAEIHGSVPTERQKLALFFDKGRLARDLLPELATDWLEMRRLLREVLEAAENEGVAQADLSFSRELFRTGEVPFEKMDDDQRKFSAALAHSDEVRKKALAAIAQEERG